MFTQNTNGIGFSDIDSEFGLVQESRHNSPLHAFFKSLQGDLLNHIPGSCDKYWQDREINCQVRYIH